MAVFPNTLSLPKFQQPMSRRAVMGTGIAATALAAVPVLAALPEPADYRAQALYHAKQLGLAMSKLSGRHWDIYESKEAGFIVVMDTPYFEAVMKAAAPKQHPCDTPPLEKRIFNCFARNKIRRLELRICSVPV